METAKSFAAGQIKTRLDVLNVRLERIDFLIARPVNKDRIVRLKAERKIRQAEAELLTLKAEAA